MKAQKVPSAVPAEMLPSPRLPQDFGPRDEAEQRLASLIAEGLASGPAMSTTLPDLMAKLRSRIRRPS